MYLSKPCTMWFKYGQYGSYETKYPNKQSILYCKIWNKADYRCVQSKSNTESLSNSVVWILAKLTLSCKNHLSRLMIKPTKWHVRAAKTQISLGIYPVWSESSLSTWRNLRSLATHSHFVGFVMRRLIYCFTLLCRHHYNRRQFHPRLSQVFPLTAQWRECHRIYIEKREIILNFLYNLHSGIKVD